MDINKQKDLFRLAAVLYADNNYEVSSKTIHKKIIESVFIDNENKELNAHQIIELIQTNYSFIFDIEEIVSIVNNPKETGFLVRPKSDGEHLICLNPNRAATLKSKLEGNSIEFYINEFVESHSELINGFDGKAIIYKFIYEIFLTNISSFSKLLDYNKTVDELINISMNSLNPIDITIINTFLQWDNDGKNKAIFDISSYALEYCLITNKNDSNGFHLSSLKNKNFYLDTNIIFRAIGINGINRKTRTLTFIDKFNEAGENILISSFTELEFKATVNYYISQIKKTIKPTIKSNIFLKFKKESEFYDYFHSWRLNRSNDSLELFQSFILSQYEYFKKKCKVKEDYKIPFDVKDENTKKNLEDLANDISSSKHIENNNNGHFESALWDAKNVYLTEIKRENNSRNIFDTKYFFISSDQALRRWDFKRNKATPCVLLPSQWLSIVLRYVNRTNDDFKSFVSFLNLSQNETNINNEKLQLVLAGIAEITQDMEQQSSIVTSMIEIQFKGILDKNTSNEDIIERSKFFAKTELELEIEKIKKQNEKITTRFETHKTNTDQAIQTLQELKSGESEKVKIITKENKELKEKIRTAQINKKLRNWRILAYLTFPLLFACISFYILIFVCKECEWNYLTKLANWINTFEEGTVQKTILNAIYLMPLAGIGIFVKFIYSRLLNNDNILEKKEKISKEITET